MFEVIKIISRIISGVFPVLWVFSYWMFLKKNKFEKMCAVLTLIFVLKGIVDCILTAIGF